MSLIKEVKYLVSLAENQGWRVSMTHKNHYKLIAPNGKVVFVSSTPSDNRAIKNIERDLRVNGLILVKKKGK